ncbi:MAG: phospholipase A2 [Thermoleophilaceae bacterium]
MHRSTLAPALALVALALAPPPAATADARAATACGPGGVGDRLVPDRGTWFHFGVVCAAHDECYAARLGQAACDGRFRMDMHAHCATRVWYQRAPCRFTAELYWEAVRRFGHLFY